MITIRTNITQVFSKLQSDLNILKDREYLLRPVATELIPQITERIHGRGEASDGSAIGTYSNSYLRYRAKNKRGADTKVILSLTRQLENDWSVVPTERGYGIGFLNTFNADKLKWAEKGHTASAVPAHQRTVNGKTVEVKAHSRSAWAGYGKDISKLSKEETEYAIDRINELVNAAINS